MKNAAGMPRVLSSFPSAETSEVGSVDGVVEPATCAGASDAICSRDDKA